MSGLAIGDRVIWLGALNQDGSSKGGWAGNGRGVIRDFQPSRAHFEGASRATEKAPAYGPAVCIRLDGGQTKRKNTFDVWVIPSSREIHPDLAPTDDADPLTKFLTERSADAQR